MLVCGLKFYFPSQDASFIQLLCPVISLGFGVVEAYHHASEHCPPIDVLLSPHQDIGEAPGGGQGPSQATDRGSQNPEASRSTGGLGLADSQHSPHLLEHHVCAHQKS